MRHPQGWWATIAIILSLVAVPVLVAACGGTASTAGRATPPGTAHALTPAPTQRVAPFRVSFHKQDAPFTCPPEQPPPFARLTFTGAEAVVQGLYGNPRVLLEFNARSPEEHGGATESAGGAGL